MRTCQILAVSIVAVLAACGGSTASAPPAAPVPDSPGTPPSPSLQPPANLRYAVNPASYTVGVPITPNAPTSDGGAPSSYAISPPLPAGLQLAVATGVISGTPSAAAPSAPYDITASNAAGHATARVVLAVEPPAPVITTPGAPTGVVAVAGDASATLTWSPPASDGGSPITGYQVTPSPAAPAAAIVVQGTGASVSGLANGTAYTFTVAAVNVAGAGPGSVPSTSVTPAAPPAPSLPPPAPPPPTPPPSPPAATAPGAPTGVSGVAGDRSISLTWTAPSSNGGSAITGYTVTPSPVAPAATITVSGASATISGLANGTTYTFTVQARTAVGTGPASAPSSGLTPRAADTLSAGTHVLAVVVTPDAGVAVPVSGVSFAITLPPGASIAVIGGGSSEIPSSALVAGGAVSGGRMLLGSYADSSRTASVALAVAPDAPWSGQAVRIAFAVAPGALVTATQVVALNTPLAPLKVVGFDVSAHRTVILTGQVRVALQVLDP